MSETTATGMRVEARSDECRPRPRLFTVDEYLRMGEAGILHEDDRVELIEGVLLEMAAAGGRHIDVVNQLNEFFVTHLSGRATTSVQNPVRLSRSSMPEPDIAIIVRRRRRTRADVPRADEVFLAVEVADASLRYDREAKVPLYAAAGIPEVWLVAIDRGHVGVYRRPQGDTYLELTTVGPGGMVAPAAFPDVQLAVAPLFRYDE
jgi:Uma2 family endonuclease